MMPFNSVKELINTLGWAKELLREMFEKRKSLTFKYDDALNDELGLTEERLETLVNKGMLRRNGTYIELDEIYLHFFEQVLEVNEEINTHYINENIQLVKQNIIYYLAENNEVRRYNYLKFIKSVLRKTGRIIIRNIVDLNRNIDNTFKTEPNYKIKRAKLENYDIKRENIDDLIEQTEKLIDEDERTFFGAAKDEELRVISIQLRDQLIESRHNLIEVQKQIIEYLNQIKYQSKVLEKIRQLKYLKDQFELQNRSDVRQILSVNRDVVFEPRSTYSLKLSIPAIREDENFNLLQKVFKRARLGLAPRLPLAGQISEDYLQVDTEEEVIINLEELKNSFAASGEHLFDFIMQYDFQREITFQEKVTLYCQMVSLYESEFSVSENFGKYLGVEYAIVHSR